MPLLANRGDKAAKVSKCRDWDLDRVGQSLVERKGYDWPFVRRILIAYRVFMMIRIMNPDVAISPSKRVDEAWHAHILDTPAYHRFCDHVNDGEYIHHRPFLKNDMPQGDPSVAKTVALYREHFGEPDHEIWGVGADCSADGNASCGNCSSSKCGPRCT